MGPTGFEPATPWYLLTLKTSTLKARCSSQAELRAHLLKLNEIGKFLKFFSKFSIEITVFRGIDIDEMVFFAYINFSNFILEQAIGFNDLITIKLIMKKVIKLSYDRNFCKNCPQPPFSQENSRVCFYFKKVLNYLKNKDLANGIDYVSCSRKDVFTHEMTYRINSDEPENCSDIEMFWKREGTIGLRNCYLLINVRKGNEKERLDELSQLLK